MGRNDPKNEKRPSTTNNKNPPKKQKTEEVQTSQISKRGSNQKPLDPRRSNTVELDPHQVILQSSYNLLTFFQGRDKRSRTKSDDSLASPSIPSGDNIRPPGDSSGTSTNIKEEAETSYIISSDSDDDPAALSNDAHWSTPRFKRILEEYASNNLASMEIIRINLSFICPEEIFANYEAQLMEDIPKFIKEVEIKVLLMKITRCRSSPPYTITCVKNSNNDVACDDGKNGEKCNHCMARYQMIRLENNVANLTTTIRPTDRPGIKIRIQSKTNTF